MPDRIDKALFLFGLSVYSVGLFAINYFGATDKSTGPIDIIHWVMLTGAVFLLPFAAKLPRRGPGLLAAPLIVFGVVCVIGMCVIDFVFWSLTDHALRNTVTTELMNTPAVWQPFMLWGNEEVLMAGFCLASLLYLKASRVGSALVVAGSAIAVLGGGWLNLIAYLLILAGFALNFSGLKRDGAGV